MSRRLDIELTSQRPDGSWTWRAAGAKNPRGDLDPSLVGPDARVGDVFKAEAEADIDGLTITSIVPDRERKQSETLELLGSGAELPGVSTRLVGKGRHGRRRDDRGGRGDTDDRAGRPPRRRDERGRGERPDRRGGPRRDEARRDRRGPGERRPARTGSDRRDHAPEAGPRPKRLRAGRRHRKAAVSSLATELRPLAEIVLRGGIPSVRQSVDRMNELNRAEHRSELPVAPLETLAERLLPTLKAAEWRDRAEAALAGIDEVDLRDLRSVIVAAENHARDDDSRELAEKLRSGLSDRVDHEHRTWLLELSALLDDGRTVRALRLSSRPPKAGAPLPADLAERLAAAAAEGLNAEVSPDRWAVVLDAVAYSPVRLHVVPSGLPSRRTDELVATVRKLADRVPDIAALFAEPAPPDGPAPSSPT